MESDTKCKLARTGDTSTTAAGHRLRAARNAVGMAQNEFAAAIGRRSSNINNMEKARSYVTVEVMTYLFREHRIDYNFMVGGLYAQLPGDVQERLFQALADPE